MNPDDGLRTDWKTDREPNGRFAIGNSLGAPYQFRPGFSGNVGGRPGRKPVTEAYQDRMNEKLPAALREVRVGRVTVDLPEGATFLDWISLGQCIEAARGNPAAAREIADRLEGKVAQALELSGEISLIAKREIIAKRRAERLNGD
jgi:hypothetical protein